MGINLAKGQKINLTKDTNNLKTILVGMGWDCQTGKIEKKGLFGKVTLVDAPDIDLDASAYIMGTTGRVARVYYGKKDSSGVHHTGDNLTGEGDGDDEQIIVRLNEVPGNVNKIAFTVDIYQFASRKQSFGMVKNAYIRLVNMDTNTELCRFELGDNFNTESAVVAGEIYRDKDGINWKFNPIGQGLNGGRDDLERMYS